MIKTMSTLLTLLFVSATAAQEKRMLDIKEALEIAMKNNNQVISAQNNYQSTVASVLPKTWGNRLPTVSASAGMSKTLMQTQTPGVSTTFYQYGLDANYVLFDGLKNFTEMKQAKDDEASSLFDLENTRQTVSLNVYNAYVEVLKNKQLLRIREENLKRSEEQLKRLEERNRLGAQILSDVYKQRVQVGSDKLAVNRAKNNLNTSKASLNSLIGIDVNTDIELKELGLDVSFESSQYDFNKAFDDALNARKDYLASRKRLESAKGSLRIARSGFMPTVTATAGYQWANSELNFGQYSNRDNATIGLNISYPIFTGFETNAQVIQADQRVQTARSNVDNTKRVVALDVKIALLNMKTAYEGVKLSEENVKAAKEDLRLATERYNLGAGTLLDQITANAGYTEAEANYVQSVYDFILAKQQYLLAIGSLDQK